MLEQLRAAPGIGLHRVAAGAGGVEILAHPAARRCPKDRRAGVAVT